MSCKFVAVALAVLCAGCHSAPVEPSTETTTTIGTTTITPTTTTVPTTTTIPTTTSTTNTIIAKKKDSFVDKVKIPPELSAFVNQIDFVRLAEYCRQQRGTVIITSSNVADTVVANQRRQEAETMFERLRANFNTFNTRESMCNFVESLARPKNAFEALFNTFMSLMPIKFDRIATTTQKNELSA